MISPTPMSERHRRLQSAIERAKRSNFQMTWRQMTPAVDEARRRVYETRSTPVEATPSPEAIRLAARHYRVAEELAS